MFLLFVDYWYHLYTHIYIALHVAAFPVLFDCILLHNYLHSVHSAIRLWLSLLLHWMSKWESDNAFFRIALVRLDYLHPSKLHRDVYEAPPARAWVRGGDSSSTELEGESLQSEWCHTDPEKLGWVCRNRMYIKNINNCQRNRCSFITQLWGEIYFSFLGNISQQALRVRTCSVHPESVNLPHCWIITHCPLHPHLVSVPLKFVFVGENKGDCFCRKSLDAFQLVDVYLCTLDLS